MNASYLYASAAILAGILLVMYSVSTVTDPFWSKRTRVWGVVGIIIGVAVTLTGVWSMTL